MAPKKKTATDDAPAFKQGYMGGMVTRKEQATVVFRQIPCPHCGNGYLNVVKENPANVAIKADQTCSACQKAYDDDDEQPLLEDGHGD